AGLIVYTLHIFFNAGLLIHSRTRIMAKLIAVSATVNIALNVLLIPVFGLHGPAIATLVSYVIFVGLVARASLPLLRVQLPWGALARYAGAAAVSSLVVARIHTDIPLLNVLLRAAVGLLLYAGAIAMLDEKAGGLALSGIRSSRRWIGGCLR